MNFISYDECITNLACSIEKYFGVSYNHSTLDYVDCLLEEKKPKHVVVLLFDGLGSRILDRSLPDDSFLRSHKYKEIHTVFPATTTAATTSIKTGLNPSEHGWLAWNTYIKPIDQTITMFLSREKETANFSNAYENLKNDVLNFDTIVSKINKNGDKAYEISPFCDNPYVDLDDMLNRIEDICSSDDKTYIYAYDDEPDHSMHLYGSSSENVLELIKIRNEKVEKLCNKLKDTMLFVIADHGHIEVKHHFLKDYPTIKNCLYRVTSNEPRSPMFFVKEEMKDTFVSEFKKYFENDFYLFSKQEILDLKLYGDGNYHTLFEDALGDFLAISKNSTALLDAGDEPLFSMHAGSCDDEIYIPLIIIDKV